MNAQFGIKSLLEEIVKLDNDKDREDFFRGLLTPQELEQLPKRLEIVKRLKKGESQWQIANSLGVGIATVTRGARELRKGRFEYV